MKLLLLSFAILIPSESPSCRRFPARTAPGRFSQIAVAYFHGIRGGARLAALNIERGASYPSVVHLKGNVEIRTNGFILRADDADYDENTGEVEGRRQLRQSHAVSPLSHRHPQIAPIKFNLNLTDPAGLRHRECSAGKVHAHRKEVAKC